MRMHISNPLLNIPIATMSPKRSLGCLGRLVANICQQHQQQLWVTNTTTADSLVRACGGLVRQLTVLAHAGCGTTIPPSRPGPGDAAQHAHSPVQAQRHVGIGQAPIQPQQHIQCYQSNTKHQQLPNAATSKQQLMSRHFSTNRSLWHNSSDGDGSVDPSSSSSSSSSSSGSSSSDTAPPGARGKDMGIVFTCAKCDTRSVKAFSRHSYEKGLVLIRCPGCKALHLIADHLGWFGDTAFKVDEYMASLGHTVKRMSLDPSQQQGQAGTAQQLSAEDLAGYSRVQQLLSTVAAASGEAGSSSDAQQGPSSNSNSSSSSNSPGCASSLAGGHGHGQSAGSDGAGGCGGQGSAQAEAAAAVDSGVVQVEPEDVEAWVRVQQQPQ